jgi:hypothetical protein
MYSLIIVLGGLWMIKHDPLGLLIILPFALLAPFSGWLFVRVTDYFFPYKAPIYQASEPPRVPTNEEAHALYVEQYIREWDEWRKAREPKNKSRP